LKLIHGLFAFVTLLLLLASNEGGPPALWQSFWFLLWKTNTPEYRSRGTFCDLGDLFLTITFCLFFGIALSLLLQSPAGCITGILFKSADALLCLIAIGLNLPEPFVLKKEYLKNAFDRLKRVSGNG
jgi:hypothetical protein